MQSLSVTSRSELTSLIGNSTKMPAASLDY